MADDSRIPPNPFTPGTGHPPPYFAGRSDTLAGLRSLVGQLDGPAKPRGQVLVAPRGYGKTVLLRKLSDAVGAEHPNTRLIHARASQVKTVPELIAVVASETGVHLSMESFGIQILGSGVDMATRQTVSAGVAVETALDGKPTVLILDEAGELQSEPGHVLLNAVESLMEKGRPIMVVLGGTPRIYAAFEAAGVTFRERFDKRGLSLLEARDSRAAIAEPMRANGLHIDAAALDHIATDAMGYPHFLQIWGRHVYAAAADRETRTIDAALVRRAHAGVRVEQEELYEGRMKELRKDRAAMAAAIRIARSFADDGGDSRTYVELDELVVASLADTGELSGKAAGIIERLHEVGFIWQIARDTADNWEAGIPSLMDYTLSRYGDRLGDGGQAVSAGPPR